MVNIYKETNKTTVVFDDVPSSTQDFLIDYIKIAYANGCRVFKEVSTITITFYDDSQATLDFINELIDIGYGGKDITECEVPGLLPLKNENVKDVEVTGSSKKATNGIMLPDGFKYKGYTCSDALKQFGDEALFDMIGANVSYKTEEMKSLKMEILTTCKSYAIRKYGVLSDEDVFNTPTEQLVDFIRLSSKVLREKTNNILTQSSFATIEDFIANADNLMLGSAYVALARELVNKFK